MLLFALIQANTNMKIPPFEPIKYDEEKWRFEIEQKKKREEEQKEELEEYIRGSTSTPDLPEKETRKLIEDAKKGNEVARDKVFQAYKKHILKYSRGFLFRLSKGPKSVTTTLEFIRIGEKGLERAIEEFEGSKITYSFRKYAGWWTSCAFVNKLQNQLIEKGIEPRERYRR